MKSPGVFVLSFALLAGLFAEAKPRYVFSGKSFHRFYNYTESEDKESGFDNWVFAQQKADFNQNFSARLEAYAFAGNSKADLIQATDRIESRSQISEVWPGDAYVQAASGPFLFKLGSQRISWQEGIGLSYTNFINARDLRTSPFDPPDQVYRSAPAANLIASGENLSLQLVYLPFAQSDLVPPFSRWGMENITLLPNQTVEIRRPSLYRPSSEYGSRATWAGEGFDLSAFYFSLNDRKLVYEVGADSSLTNLVLLGKQKVITIYGGTGTLSWLDFLFRFEYLQIPKRQWNRLVAGSVQIEEIDNTALTVAIDSPTWSKFSFSVQHSVSQLSTYFTDLERKQTESLSFVSANYNVKTDSIVRMMSLYQSADQSFFSRISYKWPLSRRTEMEIAYEGAGGPDSSQGKAYQDLNRGYLELSHAF